MSAVASKNLFDLLGNTVDIDSDAEPKALPKVVVKQTSTTKKKDVVVDTPPPAAATGGRGGYRSDRRPRGSGNDAAFRDRDAGRDSNIARGTEEGGAPPRRGGRGGGRGRGREYDRRSGTGRIDSDKQVSQGWGSNDNEWNEEKVGEEIAQTEAQKESVPIASDWGAEATGWGAEATTGWGAEATTGWGAEATTATTATTGWGAEAATDWGAEVGGEAEAPAAAPEEPEEKVKTYDDYLAERAAKAAALGALPAARQPNEGSRNDSKWKNATPLNKDEKEDVFIAGKEAKAKKEKERKQKQLVEIDQRFQEAPRGGRGDRGNRGGRGGSDRGDRRGPRGPRDGGFRQGGHRGGNNSAPINLEDNSDFPSLGA